jgi:hypothetical protein
MSTIRSRRTVRGFLVALGAMVALGAPASAFAASGADAAPDAPSMSAEGVQHDGSAAKGGDPSEATIIYQDKGGPNKPKRTERKRPARIRVVKEYTTFDGKYTWHVTVWSNGKVTKWKEQGKIVIPGRNEPKPTPVPDEDMTRPEPQPIPHSDDTQPNAEGNGAVTQG